jgi:Family of unknown function (DUF5706)
MEHNSSLINLADTKAGIILGINGIVLALLFSIDQQLLSHITKIYLICTGILLTVSSVFAVLTILPRLTSENTVTKIYFNYVQKLSRQDYLESWKNVSLNEILEDYLNNIHNLTKLQAKKFGHLSTSVVLIIIGIVMLAVSLILYYFTSLPSK